MALTSAFPSGARGLGIRVSISMRVAGSMVAASSLGCRWASVVRVEPVSNSSYDPGMSVMPIRRPSSR